MTARTLSQATDTTTDKPPIHWTAIAAMGCVAAGTGAASLFMSFHGLRDLVKRVEGVEGALSSIGPFGIDGLQVAALVAIVITAGAPFRVRFYLWTAFFGSIAVSVAMNMVDAAERHSGAAGIVLSGFWPALLAAATHVVVVAFRWWQSQRSRTPIKATAPDPQPEPTKADERSEPTDAQKRSWARQRYATARSCKKVAADMTANGVPVSEKQVERWTTDMRKKPKQAEPADDLDAEFEAMKSEQPSATVPAGAGETS